MYTTSTTKVENAMPLSTAVGTPAAPELIAPSREEHDPHPPAHTAASERPHPRDPAQSATVSVPRINTATTNAPASIALRGEALYTSHKVLKKKTL